MTLIAITAEEQRTPGRAARIGALAVSGAALLLCTVGLCSVSALQPQHIMDRASLVVELP